MEEYCRIETDKNENKPKRDPHLKLFITTFYLSKVIILMRHGGMEQRNAEHIQIFNLIFVFGNVKKPNCNKNLSLAL